MPHRRMTGSPNDGDHPSAPPGAREFPPEAFQYDAEVKAETVKLIQRRADETLDREEWVVIDGVGKR